MGGLLLAGISTTYGLWFGNKIVLEKLIPVVLKGTLASQISKLIANINFTITRLSPETQREIQQLFFLLEFAPTRFLSTSIWTWNNATEVEIESFLERWRTHSWTLFRGAYFALVKLIIGAYYAEETSWKHIGYPGPPSLSIERGYLQH